MEVLLVILLLGLLGYYLYKYGTRNYDYFKEANLPFAKPSFLIGNSGDLVFKRKSFPEFIKAQYNSFPNVKVFGYYDMGRPTFFIRDPALLKLITIKEFDHFPDHYNILDEKIDVLFGNSLISLTGQKWRDMRATLSPAFTGSKMRQMFDMIEVCGENMTKHFIQEAQAKGRLEIEMKDIFARLANDVIATTAFGIEVDSFKQQENLFYRMGKRLTNFNRPLQPFIFIGYSFIPSVMKWLDIHFIDADASDYFYNVIVDALKQREENNIYRPDMINMLLNVKTGKVENTAADEDIGIKESFSTVEESLIGKKVVERVWSDKEIASQCFIFFLAGFDTVSTALSFLSYELAVNPDIQEKLYIEISRVKGKLTYESMHDLKYLDMVISETLRKWPPAPVTDRYCMKDFHYDDGEGCQFTIEKGRSVWFPIYAFHHDPKYFPNPSKFDPERFSDENKHKINPAAYLPFGSGPRNCIGSRLALMEIKVVLFYLLQAFSFEPTEKTQIPLQYAKTQVGLITEKGVWLQMKPRH